MKIYQCYCNLCASGDVDQLENCRSRDSNGGSFACEMSVMLNMYFHQNETFAKHKALCVYKAFLYECLPVITELSMTFEMVFDAVLKNVWKTRVGLRMKK